MSETFADFCIPTELSEEDQGLYSSTPLRPRHKTSSLHISGRIEVHCIWTVRLIPEPTENMRVGTIAVRAELPATATHITDKQIQEALWHYYYDIEKSVGYLMSTYVAKKEKEKKKSKGGFISCFDARGGDAAQVRGVYGHGKAERGGGFTFR